MKVRFEITASEVAVSGFHHVITAKEAQKVLNYLKTGDSSGTQTHQTWLRAQNILAFSEDKTNARDQRKRKLLESSIKGLVGELSCALNLSVKDTVSRIEKSLSPGVKSDTLVIAALDRAAEED